MKMETIKELIDLCQSAQCAIELSIGPTGAIATITAVRNGVTKQVGLSLDSSAESAAKLVEATHRVQ